MSTGFQSIDQVLPGMRVIFCHDNPDNGKSLELKIGAQGVVMGLSSKARNTRKVAVEFSKPFSGAHGCGGLVSCQRGQWMMPDELRQVYGDEDRLIP